MSLFQNKVAKTVFIIGMSLLGLLAILSIVFAIYVNIYYKADYAAIEAFESKGNTAAVLNKDNSLTYAPEGATTGLIFYPGGKVEYTAYKPLMQACADAGILCVLVDMPFNLAVFDVDRADDIEEKYPQITDWYIGGHSLGGSMAGAYLHDNMDDFKGLILLGSYVTSDFSQTNLSALSVYGSEDKVLNKEKYDKNFSKLPKNATEVVIEGGCHGYFGMYGMQKGDGTPTISDEEQINQTASIIAEYVGV